MASGKEFPLSLVIKAVDKATAPLREINAKIQRFTAPVSKLGNSLKGLSTELGLPKIGKALGGVGGAFQNVGAKVMGLGKAVAGMVAGALFGGAGIYSLVKSAVEAGDTLSEMAQRVGLGVDAYSQLQFAAAQADVSADDFNGAMDQFNKRLGEMKAGGGPLIEFLKKVSPALATQVKGAKSTEAALDLMTKAFERVTDPGKRAALAAAVFGKSGLQMGQFLGQGSKAIEEQRQKFLKLAGSQASFAQGASDLDNAMRETETAFLGLRNAAAGALFPALTKLSGAVSDFIAKNRGGIEQWAKKAGDAISAWVEGGGLERLAASVQSMVDGAGKLIDRLGGLEGAVKVIAVVMAGRAISAVAGLVGSLVQLGAAIAPVIFRLGMLVFGPVVAAIGTFITAISAGTGVMGAFNFVLAANPIGVVIMAVAALAGAAYLIYKNWDPIKKFFGDLWDGITAKFSAAWDFIKTLVDKMGGVMNILINPIGAFTKGAAFLGGKIFGADNAAPPLGAAAAAPPPAASQSEARVSVDFANLPKGTRVTQDNQSSTPVDLSMGYSMVSQ